MVGLRASLGVLFYFVRRVLFYVFCLRQNTKAPSSLRKTAHPNFPPASVHTKRDGIPTTLHFTLCRSVVGLPELLPQTRPEADRQGNAVRCAKDTLHNRPHQFHRFRASSVLHGTGQVVIRLQTVPELRGNLERLRQKLRHARRHGAALLAYFIDDTGLDADISRQFALGNPQRFQKFLQKDLSRMRGYSVFGKHGKASLFSGNRQSSHDARNLGSTETRSAIGH